MDQNKGSSSLYLVASTAEARNSKLAREAASKLEQSRALLVECGQIETVKLLDIVLLQLQMQMRGVSESEFKALCAVLTDAGATNDLLRDADGH